MRNLRRIIKKVLTKEVILYIIFGLITTIVNWLSFYILNDIFKINENLSNIIAVVLAVLTAYITNKDWVFHSKANTRKEKLAELGKFITGRAFTMILELGLCALLFLTSVPKIITKIIITILIVIINFFVSKFFAFKNSSST